MEIDLQLNLNWEIVLETENDAYSYPRPVSQYMRQNYHHPSIYRWKVFKDGMNNPTIYIGETECLCPDRIKGYLNPGPSQKTNQRINELLNGYFADGWVVHLEHLSDLTLKLNDFELNQNHLYDKDNRRLIERILIVYYKNKGYYLLNN